MPRLPPRKNARAWALWSPEHGVLVGSVRTTRGAAIRSVWLPEFWPRYYRQGWRVVAVEVTAIYYSSNRSTMRKV